MPSEASAITADPSVNALARRSTGSPELAHIVEGVTEESAVALVMQARINGTPVEAICGTVFTPGRDPAAKPLCDTCAMVFALYGELGRAPRLHPRQLAQ